MWKISLVYAFIWRAPFSICLVLNLVATLCSSFFRRENTHPRESSWKLIMICTGQLLLYLLYPSATTTLPCLDVHKMREEKFETYSPKCWWKKVMNSMGSNPQRITKQKQTQVQLHWLGGAVKPLSSTNQQSPQNPPKVRWIFEKKFTTKSQ